MRVFLVGVSTVSQVTVGPCTVWSQLAGTCWWVEGKMASSCGSGILCWAHLQWVWVVGLRS